MDLDKQELLRIYEQGYGFFWKGKGQAIKDAENDEKDCISFTEENLYIEGDNLIALKRLEKEYGGKIKCIYIDPPYNTNKKFIYNDKFKKPKKESLSYGDQMHSNWLNMMYPRLKIARDLLTEDGVIFISIDDIEIHNLRKLCDDIFGINGFVSTFIWERKKKPSFLNANLGTKTEYILAYSKNRIKLGALSVELTTEGKATPINNSGNGLKKITFSPKSVFFDLPDGKIEAQNMSEDKIITILENDVIIENNYNVNSFSLTGEWRYSQDKINELIKNKEKLRISKIPFRPNHIKKGGEIKRVHNLLTPHSYNLGTNEDATSELESLFGNDIFDYSKPQKLLKFFIKAATYNTPDALILDFFSGSSTTAHATISLNAEDGGNRKFIMVQVPEKTAEKTPAYKEGFKNICEIGKERIRRAGKKIKEDGNLPLSNREKLNIDFRTITIDK